jgi:DNA ligase-1
MVATHAREAAFVLSPTLAHVYDGRNPTGWLMSEKLDGVRAIYDPVRGVLHSRSGKVFDAPGDVLFDCSAVSRASGDVYLDGELWLGRGQFQQAAGTVRRKGDPWAGLRYVVFDAFDPQAMLRDHRGRLARLTFPSGYSRLSPLHHETCDGPDHLAAFERQLLACGAEGVMLRNPYAPYQQGRTDQLLKVKRWEETDAVVTGYQAGVGKQVGGVGALQLRECDSDIAFEAGTGLSDRDRERPPTVGEVVIVKFFGRTDAGVPRHPVYAGTRAD